LGDALDDQQVAAMVARTRVVCTTVGPYAKYGMPLVAACAEAGVHYCDLTGETQFIRATIEAHHDRAKKSGARIVHCCGFDSIPSDLGVHVVGRHFEARGDRLVEAHGRLRTGSGGVSGGTIASMLNILEQSRSPEIRRALVDPYVLLPQGAPRGPDVRDIGGIGRDREQGRWLAPFVMAAINARIVRRSNALRGFPYGERFFYDETIDVGGGAFGMMRAAAMTGGLGLVTALGVTSPGRKLLQRVLPKPGEGPSREQRERGSFVMDIIGRSEKGERAVGRVSGNKDPGYGATSQMIGEAALCLASDAQSSEGGILTPSSAMGDLLVDRLRAVGMQLSVQ